MKIVLLALAIVIGLLMLLEVGLRLVFGFGKPLTYLPDEEIGYLLSPNQQTRRFGNWISINQYSMRSPAFTATRPQNVIRIMLLGDSVANGGWWTDQAKTISAMMVRELESAIHQVKGEEGGGRSEQADQSSWLLSLDSSQVEVLNASANSWGPRNQLAYWQRFGQFDAQAVVVLLNTDDLFAIAPNSFAVGRDRNYPDRTPPLALVEVFNRYVLPASPVPELEAANAEPGDRVGFNLEAIRQMQAIARQNNSHLLLTMTPLLREIDSHGGPRDYERQARQRLLEFTQAEQIAYLDFLPIFNAIEQPEALYQDHIHLNPQGNQLVSATISNSLQKLLNQHQPFVETVTDPRLI